MQGIAESLAELFFLKGLTLPTDQIIALIDGAIAGDVSGRGEAAIFSVKNTDASYQNVGVNCVITDIRIIGKQDYPVSSTQLNCEFDPEELEYNPTDGTLTILNFNLMDGKHITIESLGASTPGNFDTVLSRLVQLERLTAIIQIVDFIYKAQGPLPPGFADVTAEYAGRFIIGVDGAQVPFNQVNKIGGNLSVLLSVDNMPAGVRVNGEGSVYSETAGATGNTKKNTAAGGAQPVSIVPTFITVRFIRYIG